MSQPQSVMSPQQALNLVDQVCAAFAGSRADHGKLIDALQVLNGVVNPPAPTPPAETSSKTAEPAKKS